MVLSHYKFDRILYITQVFRVPSNNSVNLIRYSLNHEKKLVTNYTEVGPLLKAVELLYILHLRFVPIILMIPKHSIQPLVRRARARKHHTASTPAPKVTVRKAIRVSRRLKYR